jgi:hypothetical protein
LAKGEMKNPRTIARYPCMTSYNEMLDPQHCRRKGKEYYVKGKAMTDPKLKSAFEATAREYAERLKHIKKLQT